MAESCDLQLGTGVMEWHADLASKANQIEEKAWLL
jgi:hypothetical protein